MKKALSKKWLAAGMSVMLLVTAACSSGSGNKEENGGGEKKIELTMMHNWSAPNVDNEIYKAKIQAFQDANPNITIKEEEVAAAQYMTKLRTLATGRSLPDISVVWPGAELAPLVDGGVIQPIDDIMSAWEGLLPEDALKGFNIDGKQYAVPAKQTFMDIIYYNKELLAQVGYTQFPSTYSEFIEMVKKLNDAGVTPISLGNKDRWPLQSSYMSIIGDRFTGSDFLDKVLKGEAKFTDPEYVKALGVIEELSKLGAFNPDMNTMDAVQSQDYFIQGKAAMTITSSTTDGRIRYENENGDKIGIALFPSVEGGAGDPKKSAGVIQYGLALNADLEGEKKEAAEKFIQFFYDEELYKSLAAQGIVVPANIELSDEVSPYLEEMIALTSNGTAPVFDSIVPIAVKDAIENGLQAVTIGQKTAQQVAEEMQAAVGQ